MKQSQPMTEQQRKLELIKPLGYSGIIYYEDGDVLLNWEDADGNYSRSIEIHSNAYTKLHERAAMERAFAGNAIPDNYLIAFARGGWDEVFRMKADLKALQAVVDTIDTPATNDYDNF